MATDQLSKVFSALSDPTRRDILQRLGDGKATVTELAEPFPISLPAVSRHLKVLEQAGLISRDRQAQWRTSSLRAEPLKEATTWMEHLSHVWDERFDRLDAHLAAMKKQLPTPPEDKDQNDD
jgi:DNA-binding transcriptional ArsR family regulator